MGSSSYSDTSGLHLSKIKFLFIFLILGYILYGWLTFRCTSTCLSCPESKKPTVYHHYNVNIPTTVAVDKGNGAVTLKRINSNYDLRNMGLAESNEELEFLLNIRKLIVYSVHELNKPLQFTGCVKWWANPLDLISHEVLSKSETHTKHEIKFYVQPGNVRFKVGISQKHPPIEITDDELEFLGPILPLDGLPAAECNGTKELGDNARKTCLCATAKEIVDMEKLTAELRAQWDSMDKELVTWPPNLSFSIPDYMNFTDYESFLTSPGKEEFGVIGYVKEFCGPDVEMLVMISSAPGHFQQRKNIRQTFANPEHLKGKGVKVVFLMGIPKNQTINEQVVQEAAEMKDIIQANFMDSYHNLTVSHLSMYKWAQLTCEQGKSKGISIPKHILKADDDFLLNVELALKVARNNSDVEFIGCLFCGTKVVRNVNYMYKYYTPRYMHISGSYAGYLSGVVYLLNTNVIPRLLHMSITTPIIHMDDAYVSGILVRQLKIYPRSSPLLTYGRTEPDSCLTKKMVSSYVLNPDDMIVQWKKFIEPAPPNCSLDHLPLKIPELDVGTIRSCFFN